MTPADRAAKIAELRAEADRLEGEGKRNWPETLRIGDLAQHTEEGYTVMVASTESGRRLIVVAGDQFPGATISFNGLFGESPNVTEDKFTYLGHARDLLTIKTPDAPEPTGAELVGKAVHVRDAVNGEWCTKSCGGPIIVVEYNPNSTLPYTVQSGNRWKFARLAKEQP